MNIEIEHKELHEILCGLHRNRAKIATRLRYTERQLAEIQNVEGGGDKDRILYLTTIAQLRESRIRTIEELCNRLERFENEL